MKVEYLLSRADWVAYFLYQGEFRSRRFGPWPTYFRALGVVFFFVSLLVLGAVAQFYAAKWVFGLIDERLAVPLAFVAMAMFGVVAPIIFAVFAPRKVPRDYENARKRQAQRAVERGVKAGTINPGTRHELTLAAEGLRLNTVAETWHAGVFSTVRTELRVSWAAVRSVETREGLLFVMLNSGGCVFVPCREFPAGSAVKFTDFVEAAERWWESFSSAGAPAEPRSTAIQTDANP
jgi:hypothetical protein